MNTTPLGIVETPELATAKAMLRIMTGATRCFPAELVREPSLHILLHAFIARQEGRHVTISQLSDACGMTPSTTLRCVVRLEEFGYVERVGDPHDRRRFWVEISTNGSRRMEQWLAAISPTMPVPVHH